MSLHRSLKQRKSKRRSVLKRHERLAKAIREKKWREGMSIFGLPKFNPPKYKIIKAVEEKIALGGIGKTDIIQQHLEEKAKKEKDKKQRKSGKETTGRK